MKYVSGEVASTEVAIIKEAVLGFIHVMDEEKRSTEQKIREITDNVNNQFLAQGTSPFTISQIQQLGKSFRDEYTGFYKNTIYLKQLSVATSAIRTSIEYGFVNSGLIQEEWLEAFKNIQEQLNNYEGLSGQLEQTEAELKEQHGELTNIKINAKVTAGDLAEFEAMMADKDRIIVEKDQELLNLSEGLSRMETQVNNMGETLLENSMKIEELQSAIGEKDDKIASLEGNIRSGRDSSSEVGGLRDQLREAQLKNNELEDQISSASGDLVDQLQSNLEKSREEVLKTRKDLVEKSEEVYTMKMYQDEMDTKARRTWDRLNSLEEENKKFADEIGESSEKIEELEKRKQTLETDQSDNATKLQDAQIKLKLAEVELKDTKGKLAGFEGQDTITPEEQARFNREIEQLQTQVAKYNDVVEYFKNIFSKDSKFQALVFLDTLKEEIRIDNLSKGIGLPQETVEKAVIELAEAGLARSRKEGRYLFVSKGDHTTPFELQEITAST